MGSLVSKLKKKLVPTIDNSFQFYGKVNLKQWLLIIDDLLILLQGYSTSLLPSVLFLDSGS